jgi:uncharacterized protein (UPF0276 family)
MGTDYTPLSISPRDGSRYGGRHGGGPFFGVGFRSRQFDEIVGAPQLVDWFEILADNFIGAGGPRRRMLERLRADYPIAVHGVSLSIGGADALPREYLHGLRALADWLDPVWVSDHLCWTSLGGRHAHDLLPLAYTAEVLDHVAARVARVQDLVGRRLLLENPSAYVAFRADEMDEASFFAQLCGRTGCGMLLDVNNLYVNAANLGIDPTRYLDALPPGIVGYLHLAGHAVLPDVRIDTHDADVPPPVWGLFDAAACRFPAADVIVERDDQLPPFARLVEEVEWARARHGAARAGAFSRGSREPRRDARRASATGSVQRRGRASAQPSTRTANPDSPVRRWKEVQRGFWAMLTDRPRGFDHDRDATLPALLDDTRPVCAARGMRVYSDAYAATLRRALAVNFPALARVIGAGELNDLADAYVRRYPPRTHEFRGLGARLAAFVRAYPFAGNYGVDRAVLAELVALEQAQIEVSDAADETEAAAPDELATIAPAQWENARFDFTGALRIVHTTHDVLPVLEAVARGEDPARPLAAPCAYLVSRGGGTLQTARLSEVEACVLEALLAGRSFGSACALAERSTGVGEGELVTAAARILLTACSRGLVVRVRLRNTA